MNSLFSKICSIRVGIKLGGILIMLILLSSCKQDDVPEQESNLPDLDPTEDFVSQDYLPINWECTEIKSMDLNTGEFSLCFNGGKIPDFNDNCPLVVLQTDTSGYLRRVIDAKANGNTVTLQTIEATMEELFHDTEFTLAIGENTDSRLISSGNVYTPARIVEIYSDNTYKVVYDKSQSRADYTEIKPETPIKLINIDRSGSSLNVDFGDIASTGISLEAEKYVHSLTNTVLMHVNFGPAVNTKEITKDYKAKVSDIKDFTYKNSFDFLSQTSIRLSSSRALKLGKDVTLQAPLYFLYVYFVGPVPIFFKENVEFKAAYELGIEDKFSSTFGYEMKGNIVTEIKYKKGEAIKTSIKDSFSSECYPFECKMNNPSIYSKLSIYPEVGIKIYGTIGPNFAIVPYAENRLFANLVTPQFIGWSNQFNLGLDMMLGGEITFLGLKGNISTNKPIASKEVFCAPKYIRLSAHSDGAEVELGRPVTVTFKVTGERTPLFSSLVEEEPVELALVRFTSVDGTIDGKEYATTDSNGNVQIRWIPTGKNASISAVILDQDGKELDKATFTPSQDEEENVSIVGTWEKIKTEVQMIYQGELLYTSSSSPSDYGYRDFWVLREDGTIDGYDTDAVAWPYGTYTFTGSALNVHYLNDSGSDEIAPVIKLTKSELVVRNITEDPDSPLNKSIATTYYERVTNQNLIDKIDQKTQNNPAKWWK